MKDSVIHIEKPCSADWNMMEAQSEGRFCSQCQTTVVDFTKYTTEEIKDYFTKNQEKQVCGLYHQRQTTQSTQWMIFVNKMESWLIKRKLRKVALYTVIGLLFLSSCARRRLMGAYTRGKQDSPRNLSLNATVKKENI